MIPLVEVEFGLLLLSFSKLLLPPRARPVAGDGVVGRGARLRGRVKW